MSHTMLKAVRFSFALALVLCVAVSSFAATVGKISGTVLDKGTKEPLAAASVRIDNTTMGAMANEKGVFFILNVAPGLYDVTVNVVGYKPLKVTGIKVFADQTTFQNFDLESTVLEVTEAVTVVAERPLVEKNLTASRTVVEATEIKSLPVVSIAEVVLTTAGSFAGNLRGGRAQDQQTTLDGSTVTSGFGNTGQAFTVNPFMIQELEVKTGTYNAEYANSLSGITSVVTKDGGSKFSGNMEFRTLGQKGLNWMKPPDLDLVDKYKTGESNKQDLLDFIHSAINATNAYNNDPARANDGLKLRNPFDKLDTAGTDPASWTARYSRENYYWDYDRVIPEAEGADWSYLSAVSGAALAAANSQSVNRVWNPNKYNAFAKNNRTNKRPTQFDWGMGGPLGKKMNWFASGRFAENWGRNPNEYNRLMNFFSKMTIRPSSGTKLGISGLIEDTGFFSKKGQRGVGYTGKYIAENINQSYGGRIHINSTFSHTLSARTFYEIRFSHLREYNESYNPKYGKEPLPNPSIAGNRRAIGYTPFEQSSNPAGYAIYGDGAFGVGPSANYASQRPFNTDINFAITSQVTPNHQLKAGVGLTMYDYHQSDRGTAQSGAPEAFGTQNGPGGSTNVIKWQGIEYHVYPTEYAVFAQDRIEYGGLIVNAGIRLDVFNANANSINPFRPRQGASQAFDDPNYRTQHPSIKTSLAPRLGISHPITDKAALHYSYGVFSQRPTFSDLYLNLVVTAPAEGHGNTDLPFQKSTNYEMGVQAEVYSGYYLDVTGYFRDVDKLALGYRIIPDAEFIGGSQRELTVLYPTFAQDARGLEISARRALANHFSIRANYTISFTTDLGAPPGTTPTVTSFSELANGTPSLPAFQRRASVFDRRHRLVTNLLFELPFGVTTSFLTQLQSGNEFRSKNESAIDPLGLLGKARRSPWTTTTDMYAQKAFRFGKNSVGFFADIRNIFNRTNIYQIGDSPAAERWIRRGDPVGFAGGPIAGIGTQSGNPRDIYLGVNMSW